MAKKGGQAAGLSNLSVLHTLTSNMPVSSMRLLDGASKGDVRLIHEALEDGGFIEEKNEVVSCYS